MTATEVAVLPYFARRGSFAADKTGADLPWVSNQTPMAMARA